MRPEITGEGLLCRVCAHPLKSMMRLRACGLVK